MLLLLPWHLDQFPADSLNMTLPGGVVEVAGQPGATSDRWQDLVGVYTGLADAVANTDEGE